MKTNFDKIQKRMLITALIKSAVLGVAVGLICAGAVLLALKLAGIYIFPAYFVLIGVGAAGLTCGGAFLILCPNDKKTAKYLDKEYGLNEKIQTMVEYGGKDGEMLEMQRMDAEAKLADLPKRKPKISRLWQYAVTGVLGVALIVASLVVPSNYVPVDGEKEDPFTFTDRQKQAMQQLIDDVKTTHLDEKRSETVLSSLESLNAAPGEAGTVNLMKTAVLTTVSLVDVVLYTQNSFDDVSFVLGKTEALKPLSEAVNGGVAFYKGAALPYVSIEQVNNTDKVLEETVAANINGGLTLFREDFRLTKADGLGEFIVERSKEITSTLVMLNSVSTEDALRVALVKFAAECEAIAENAVNGYADGALQDSLNSAFASVKSGVTVALMPQAYNCIVDEFIRRQLAQIFGLGIGELPALASGVQELDEANNDGDDDDDDNNGGADGKGDFVVGSDATIFHPDTGEIVPYGQYISEYYDKVNSQAASGEIPDGLKEYILEYFSTLFSGFNNAGNGESGGAAE